jgi:hypothetical protein
VCSNELKEKKNVPDLCAFFVLSSMSRANTKKQIPPVTEWGTKSQKQAEGKTMAAPNKTQGQRHHSTSTEEKKILLLLLSYQKKFPLMCFYF